MPQITAAILFMKKTIILIITAFTMVAALHACYYDKAELVYPSGTANCDTSAVKYSTDIVGILSANCYSCHAGTAVNGSGIQLDTYAGISAQANAGILLPVIQHDPGYVEMPKGGTKLSECNIAKIRTWIRNGAPNN